MVIIVINFFPVILFIAIGLLIKYKKAYWLISGYNTMPEEKKKNVDTEGLGKLISNMCFALAALFIVSSILMLIHRTALALIVFILIMPVIIYTLINAQKYDGNVRNSKGTMKTGTKILIGSIVSVLFLIAIGIGAMAYSGSKTAGYSIDNGMLKISGIYGQEIPIYEISGLELKQTIPEVLQRTNGSAVDSMLKGNFKLKDIGAAKLFVDAEKPPFIYLKWNSTIYYLDSEESGKTEELYNLLSEELKKSTQSK
jgi:membrane protein implicated in regulation of membrane protease activity